MTVEPTKNTRHCMWCLTVLKVCVKASLRGLFYKHNERHLTRTPTQQT